jgi:hypothetical protein
LYSKQQGAGMYKSDVTEYDTRHGGAWDRGSADSYYSRSFDPHYYVGGTHVSDRVEMKDMTATEITAYSAGYAWNETHGDKKAWR